MTTEARDLCAQNHNTLMKCYESYTHKQRYPMSLDQKSLGTIKEPRLPKAIYRVQIFFKNPCGNVQQNWGAGIPIGSQRALHSKNNFEKEKARSYTDLK